MKVLRLNIIIFGMILYYVSIGLYQYSMEVYEYMGFVRHFSLYRLFSTTILIILLLLIFDIKSVLGKYHTLLLVFLVIPSSVIYVFQGGGKYILVTYLASALVILLSRAINLPALKIVYMNDEFFYKLCILLIGLYFILLLGSGAGRFINFNLLKVYELRREAAQNLPGIFSYLSPIISKIVVPLFIVFSLERKNYLFALLGLLAGVFIFALTAHKSPLFYSFAVIFIYFIYNKNFSIIFLAIITTIVAIGFFDIYLYHFVENEHEYFGLVHSLFFRRALLVPSFLNSQYIDFFSQNDFYYWANSKLSLGLVNTDYDLNAPFLIGREYWGRENMSANVGFIGSGFSNAGVVGVIFYSIIFALFLSLLKSLSKKIGERLVFCASFITVAVMITSTDLTTVFITHGAIFLILILLLMPKAQYGFK